jgi:hypothetical protein
MFTHSTRTASFFSVLIVTLIFSLSLAGVAAAQQGNTRRGQGTNPTNSDPQGNTAGGTNALLNNLNLTNGDRNTAFGEDALEHNTTSDNTAVGFHALHFNTTGSLNTASGVNALMSNTTGENNTASGVQALFNNTTGFQNTASGEGALFSNTTCEGNTATGVAALVSNTTGNENTASGANALNNNTTGNFNTAIGNSALSSNTTGVQNIAIGVLADVSAGNLTNATAIGFQATVNASNKVRLGNTQVTVIEGQVAFTSPSDKTKKENFEPVDGEAVLGKIRGFELTSWNFIGHDPKEFRHYGPMAQDFFAAFGYDAVGQIGTETTINSGDLAGILMIAVQALEKRTAELKQREARIAVLESRLEALEQQKNKSTQIADVMQ